MVGISFHVFPPELQSAEDHRSMTRTRKSRETSASAPPYEVRLRLPNDISTRLRRVAAAEFMGEAAFTRRAIYRAIAEGISRLEKSEGQKGA